MDNCAVQRATKGDIQPDTSKGSLSATARHSRLGWKTSVPWDFLFVGLACCIFVAVAVLVSLATGAPFVAPIEPISPAIGMPSIMPLAIGVAGYLLAHAFARRFGTHTGSRRAWRLAALADTYFVILFVIVIYVHFHFKMWMHVINPALYDPSYFAIDHYFGFLLDLARFVRSIVAWVLPEAALWYGGALLAMFVLSFWFHAFGSRRWHYHNMTALLLVEMIGPLAYLIAPAVGPFIYESGPSAVESLAQHSMYRNFKGVEADGIQWLAIHGGEHLTSLPAAMPSLHVAAASIIVYYACKARLVVAPVLVVLCLCIVVESVVSRWHYLIDLPPGFALAFIVIAVTNRVCRWRFVTGDDKACATRPGS